MLGAYYSAYVSRFLQENENMILGIMAKKHEFPLEDLQRNAWISQISILKRELSLIGGGYILFEYSIPRMGKRADVILLAQGTVFVLEFKMGSSSYTSSAINQVFDYALDLKNFHRESHHVRIVPILVATKGPADNIRENQHDDGVLSPLRANGFNLSTVLKRLLLHGPTEKIDPQKWEHSAYEPTPTIVEAAQALYEGHSVDEISRSDSSVINLSKTSNTIVNIIEESKADNKKSICFVTGVPGSGKTLAGLNIANQRLKQDENEFTVFLSGNGPLVKVLQEALARNEIQHRDENGNRMGKLKAKSKTKAFIQNVHHFRDSALQSTDPPLEKVVIFDEAQRAWTKNQTANFMQRRKGIADFSMSEPEFLITAMDRHEEWATIVCLVGGGQEINTGEAGLLEWFEAIRSKFPDWKVYISDKLTDREYTRGHKLAEYLAPNQMEIRSDLHLGVSVRSFRSERVSSFVKAVLDVDRTKAASLLKEIGKQYPIFLTRDIDIAKKWLKEKARGTERYGIIASSRAHRLRPYGIIVKSQIKPEIWFLNDKRDIRSSYYMEDVATEFDIQGLELDWVCVGWDGDLRFNGLSWDFRDFKGTKWYNVNDEMRVIYLINTYRVLLTRARQGFIIFIPEGDPEDNTRHPDFYDSTYRYLEQIGISSI